MDFGMKGLSKHTIIRDLFQEEKNKILGIGDPTDGFYFDCFQLGCGYRFMVSAPVFLGFLWPICLNRGNCTSVIK